MSNNIKKHITETKEYENRFLDTSLIIQNISFR